MGISLGNRVLLALGLLATFKFVTIAAESIEDRKELIRDKISQVFHDDPDSFTRAMLFLDKEDKDYKDQAMSPVWKTLNRVLDKDTHFKSYLNRLVQDTRTGKENESYGKLIEKIWSEFLQPSDNREDPSKYQGLQLKGPDKGKLAGFGGILNGWNLLSEAVKSETLKEVVQLIERHSSSISILKGINYENVGKLASVLDHLGAGKGTVALAAVVLTVDAWNNVRLWLDEEISGAQCLKNIVDSFATVCTAAYFGTKGAEFGSAYGPVGTMIGGGVGGFVGGFVGHSLSDWLTQMLFNLPKQEALQNAYEYLGIEMTASNEEVNQKYWELNLKHDPMRGGWEDEFNKVQYVMAVVKVARGQRIN